MNDWDEDDLEKEGPQSIDLEELGYDADRPDTVTCPFCGEEVYDDVDRCSACGHFLTQPKEDWSDKTWWWVLLGLAGLVAIFFLATC
ncbi:MAG: zinc ribbon domain-containing protein [Phycisphaerae bacterium]|nr:zinc ribbon domain-containing protein [Phycisphaerae bacterium]MDP7637893.1 zinc ribbon domain-containing protein [Phycisphaerae bacterium]